MEGGKKEIPETEEVKEKCYGLEMFHTPQKALKLERILIQSLKGTQKY